MTKTIQPRSWALLSETGKDLTLKKPEAEDNMSLLLSVFDSLNTLHEMLFKLNSAIERKIIEQSPAAKALKDFPHAAGPADFT